MTQHKASVFTLALLGALALAAISGGLLPSDHAVHAQAACVVADTDNCNPYFSTTTVGRSVDENTPPGFNLGAPFTATDPDEADEFGDTLTYSLEGTDAASFNLDASTGQLSTKAALDHEDPQDSDISNDYVVTVRAEDSRGGSSSNDDSVTVTITVTDADEPPLAPGVPTVTSDSNVNTSLVVIWYSPDNTGPTITDYDVEYKKITDTDFTVASHSGPGTTITITGLEASTSYQVRVRAKNGESDSTENWSFSGTGSTNTAGNSAPTFPETPPITRSVAENTPVGQNVGAAVTATDPDGGLLVHSLEGPDRDSFDIDSGNGQLTTNAALDADTKDEYLVTVTVEDGDGGSAAIKVTIRVDNVDEPPSKPDAPTVTPTEDLSTSLDVSWVAPANMGPPITTYDVQYRAGTTGNFTNGPQNVAGTSDKIATNLTAGTSYQVRVRGTNAEGASPWSNVGTGQTSPANNEPGFSTATTMRSVPENTQAGQPVGAAVSATTDPDGDALTYSLEASADTDAARAEAASFDIVPATGQIRTKSPLNHEGKSSYTVKVGVSDGLNDHRVQEETATTDDTITVTIEVTDVDEPPTKPYAPTVISGSDTTSLAVSWDAPEFTGRPAITDYDVRYRAGGGFVSSNVTVTNTGATITGLDADTSYQVQVRATSDEGTGPWSDSGAGSTNADGNAAPTFATPIPAPSVDENTQSGQDFGTPIAANDTDGGTLSYSLGKGVDEDSFTIVAESGQIQTKSPLDREGESSYTVTVKVEDGQGGSATTEVTITVTNVDEPPSRPDAPTVTEDSSTSLEVSWNEPANTGPDITEYDVQYREGSSGTFTDWAHNDTGTTATINTGLTADTTYEVRVRAKNGESDATENWSDPGSGTTGTVNSRPVFSSGATAQRSVAENTRAGQAAGGPVAATDSDSNTLTYSLDGVHEDLFGFDTGTGQIRTKTPLDYESRSSYSLTVKVDDGTGRSNSSAAISVTIAVTDMDETPSATDRPTVMATGSTTNVRVTWDQPANMGPAIIYYEVQYREGSSDPFRSWPHNSLDTTTIITGLSAGPSYQVQVRAGNEDGQGGWSVSGTGSPSVDIANTAPVFSAETATWSVDENTAAGIDIGSPVQATDADRDLLTYTLEGTDAASFAIVAASGQIRTREPLNHEEKSEHSVTVKADDRRGGSDTIAVTITVTDVDGESPAVPDAPTVTATAGSSTSLDVSWDAPDNPGPPITDYDYRYKETAEASWTEVVDTTITDTTVAISELTADTSYDVQVRATNDEGTSGWSDSGTEATNLPGVNSPPVFAIAPVALSVRENLPVGTTVGSPVTATDPNEGDTLTYTLGGEDAASFTIVAESGQIQTAVVLDQDTRDTHTVTVTANDGTDDSEPITVTITVTDVTFGCATAGAVDDPSNTGLVSDCEALLEARDKLENGARILNWSVVRPIAEWDGIRSDSLEGTPARVTRLYLHRIGLNGSIAAELGQVSELKWLYLHGNDLAGVIPGALNRLSKLERLYLYDNGLTGLSSQLGSGMAQLRRFFAHRNSIAGSIPAGLGSMPRLDWLRLDRNRLAGSIPSQLGSLSTLRRLYLHEQEGWSGGGGFSGSIPSTFANLSRLEYLVVHRNSLSGTIPGSLGGLTNLKWLGLYDNNFSGSIPSQMGSLSNLERLYLHGNQLTGQTPSQLGNMSALTNLWLKNNGLTGTIPNSLNNLTNLERVRISGNQFTGCVPPALDLQDDPATDVVESDDLDELGLPICP